MREIEFLQRMLYAAKMPDMSVYEKGDNPIAKVSKKYLDSEGKIKIEENELLLIDDVSQIRYGRTAQDVYDILVDWNVIAEVNAQPYAMAIVLNWFNKKGVITDIKLNEYAKINKLFSFEGKMYYPIGNILGGFSTKARWCSTRNTIPYSGHENFYKIAKKHKASCDIFFCYELGDYFIPCETCLCELYKSPVSVFQTKYFKDIDSYMRWYQ